MDRRLERARTRTFHHEDGWRLRATRYWLGYTAKAKGKVATRVYTHKELDFEVRGELRVLRQVLAHRRVRDVGHERGVVCVDLGPDELRGAAGHVVIPRMV